MVFFFSDSDSETYFSHYEVAEVTMKVLESR